MVTRKPSHHSSPLVELAEFEPEEHFWLLLLLLRRQKHLEPSKADLPAIGWMATQGETPIAFIFLRKVEPNLAFIDGLVTNPDLKSPLRHEAIELLVNRAETAASALGIKRLITHSADKSVLMRALARGYVLDAGLILSKEVT